MVNQINSKKSPKKSSKKSAKKSAKKSSHRKVSKTKSPKHDPNAKTEAQKYEQPIASREWLISVLTDDNQPRNREEIAEMVNIHSEQDVEALRRRLRAMVRDGQLVCSRKGYYSVIHEVHDMTGTVELSRNGDCFIRMDDNRVYIREKQMRMVFIGDEVKVKVANVDSEGRYVGQIIDIIKRSTKTLIGRVNCDYGVYYIVPENAGMHHRVLLLPGTGVEAQVGDMVVCEITLQPTLHTQAAGSVIKVLGDSMDAETAISAALDAFDIPHEFNQKVAAENDALPDEVQAIDLEERKDFRKLPLITIDGEDARDFDDAVYCERQLLGGWKLIVAIADVSHYVQPGSALDDEAIRRGNSTYFPGTVVPMLPEKISNGLCSLKPKVDRLCLACEMTISKKGELKKFQFYPAVMHSHARLTYNQVNEILTEDNTPLHQEFADVLPNIHELYALFKAFRVARHERGALDFDTKEALIHLDDDGVVSELSLVTRNEAHMLIEECMLHANISAARFLLKAKVDGVYRIHDGPKSDKLEDLHAFLKLYGLSMRYKGVPETKDFAEVLKQTAGRPDAQVIQTMVLRTMNQAVYSSDNIGHFGLAYEEYTHYTSPIRRYPDLIVHRLIKSILKAKNGVKYTKPQLIEMCEHTSMTERRSDDASRDVMGALKCAYVKRHEGEDFEGVISGVTNFGFFVSLNDIPVDGLVHVTQLNDDYYQYDSGHQTLMGERRRKIFKLGDKVSVRINKVDVAGRKIDFELLKN